MSLRDHLDADDRLSVRDDGLTLEDCALVRLAERFGTPLNLVSEERLRLRARELVREFSAAWRDGPVQVLPSLKANFSLALRRVLTEEGLGCDTFGTSELRAALACGVPPALISVNGSSKSPGLLREALLCGAHLTLDSLREARLVAGLAGEIGIDAFVRLRLRPDLDSVTAPSEFAAGALSVGEVARRYKPGFPRADLAEAAAVLREAPGVTVTGCHVHVGRHMPHVSLMEAVLPCVALELRAFADAMGGGWVPAVVDVGGGFSPRRDPAEVQHLGSAGAGPADPPLGAALAPDAPRSVPSVADYAAAVATTLRRALRDARLPTRGVTLQIEPGRSLYANAGLHLTRVVNLKREAGPGGYDQRWVETDTSEAFLPDVTIEGARWTVVPVAAPDAPPAVRADVVGISCGFDLLVAGVALPELAEGDLLAFLDTGAYQDAGANNFNAMPRPATVLVRGAEAEVIRRAETVAGVFARDVVPARLGEVDTARLGTAAGAGVLHHAGMVTTDLERSVGFYARLLGIEPAGSGREDDPVYATLIGVPHVAFRWAEFDLGSGQVLELIEWEGDGAPDPAAPAAGARPAAPDSTHVALRVADIDAAHGVLVDAGVTVFSAPVELREENHWLGTRVLYARDPDGNLIELVQEPGTPN
jgi:diaminopimelate decarboxylase